jgi:hypothetical protein
MHQWRTTRLCRRLGRRETYPIESTPGQDAARCVTADEPEWDLRRRLKFLSTTLHKTCITATASVAAIITDATMHQGLTEH